MSSKRLAGAVAALALLAPASAQAVVYYGTYMPSNTAVTHRNEFLPLDYRAPDAGQSFTAAASVSGSCMHPSCVGFYIGDSVTTDFVAPTSFEAKRMIVPALVSLPYGNRRVGFSISHFDAEAGAWEGLGYMQLETQLQPQGVVHEVDAPFGESGARFVDFNYKPIAFEAGELYRISASAWAGALGTFSWYLSDVAAAPGQSVQYQAIHASTGGTATNLQYQPAFAFTDGGELVAPPGGVPEPGTWSLMIMGFGALGAGLVMQGGDDRIDPEQRPILA
ncbi:MAG TPA: PEP-CTERM sorting domain-containing protein, partial [Azospirillaceae bacterium]|nr:PEP-CTERM sorting domain-containing protein [Azospirillaceae bacterium]